MNIDTAIKNGKLRFNEDGPRVWLEAKLSFDPSGEIFGNESIYQCCPESLRFGKVIFKGNCKVVHASMFEEALKVS